MTTAFEALELDFDAALCLEDLYRVYVWLWKKQHAREDVPRTDNDECQSHGDGSTASLGIEKNAQKVDEGRSSLSAFLEASDVHPTETVAVGEVSPTAITGSEPHGALHSLITFLGTQTWEKNGTI